MRSLCKKFLPKINIYFSPKKALLELKLYEESKFAIKIDLSTHLEVEWCKLLVFGPFWPFLTKKIRTFGPTAPQLKPILTNKKKPIPFF